MHYKIYVIGSDVEEQLTPYGCYYEVPKRKVQKVTDEDKKEFLAEYGGEMDDFEKVYEEFGQKWNCNSWEKDAFGVWYEFSYSNPDEKWDWYSIGGRWQGGLKLKDGSNEDMALVGDVDWDNTNTYCYAIVADGEWIDFDDSTGAEARTLLERVDKSHIITIVDIHD